MPSSKSRSSANTSRRSLLGAAACIFFVSVAAGPDPRAQDRPLIAVSTSILELAVGDLLGDRVVIHSIAPPGSCPGHYDLKPDDLAALSGARVIVLHDFQSGMRDKLVKVGYDAAAIISVPEKGTMATPAGYGSLLDYLASHLPVVVPELAGPAKDGLAGALARVEQARARAEAVAGERLRGKPVVVAHYQKDFVEYYGMRPAAVIQPGEPSVRELNGLVKAAKAAGAVAVVGNRQSGEKSFAVVAGMLDLPLIMLSNFPEKTNGKLDYEEFLLGNVRALEDGLAP